MSEQLTNPRNEYSNVIAKHMGSIGAVWRLVKPTVDNLFNNDPEVRVDHYLIDTCLANDDEAILKIIELTNSQEILDRTALLNILDTYAMGDLTLKKVVELYDFVQRMPDYVNAISLLQYLHNYKKSNDVADDLFPHQKTPGFQARG